MLLLIIVLAGRTYAQQEVQYSQYMVNYLIINPGVAGTGDQTEFRAGIRSQWTGFEGAPRTVYLSAHGALNKVDPAHITRHKNDRYQKKFNPHGYHGLGGLIYNDATGPISRSGVYAVYAYNLALTSTVRASLGAMAGLKQFRVDGSKLEFFDSDDPLQAGQTALVPDAAIGMWVYGSRFYAGASVQQVAGNEVDRFTGAQGSGRLSRHYFATAGLNIALSKKVSWIPSILIRNVDPAPLSFDVNNKFRFQNIGWTGFSYRNEDSFVAMAGVFLKANLEVSYSYDVTRTVLNNYSRGSHELVVGLRLNKKPKTHNPSDFW